MDLSSKDSTSEVWISALEKFDEFLEGCSGRIKWASINSVAHLTKALEIASIDPAMAAFRSVCAEEEVASALIFSLKEQNYEGAGKIYFRHHADKHAVIIFVSAVSEWFKKKKAQVGQFGKHRIYFDDISGRKGLRLGIQLGDTDVQVNPTPPLHLLTQGDRSLADEFQDEMMEFFGLEKISEIKRLIDERANFRNTILYATPHGIPKPSGDISIFIANQAGIVNSLLTTLAFIDPWRTPDYPHSGIVIESIRLFASVMERVERQV